MLFRHISFRTPQSVSTVRDSCSATELLWMELMASRRELVSKLSRECSKEELILVFFSVLEVVCWECKWELLVIYRMGLSALV